MTNLKADMESPDTMINDRLCAISVVMTTYNGSIYLEEQISSIIEQLGEHDEVIISDDGSSDDTLDILNRFASDQIRIVRTDKRLGPIFNFEHALGYARYEIIVLSDQDDRWLPGRLQRVRKHFSAGTDIYDLLVMNSVITDGTLKPTHDSLFKHLNAGPGLVKNIYRNTYVGCHMAFRRSLLDVAMPFPAAIPMHDMWLGLVSEWIGPVTFDPVPTLLWRRTGQNYTKDSYSFRQQIVWRIGLVSSLLRRRLSTQFRSRPQRTSLVSDQ